MPGEPTLRQRRAFAHRRDRLDAGGAKRRTQTRQHRHERPEDDRDLDSPGLDQNAAVWERETDRVEQRE